MTAPEGLAVLVWNGRLAAVEAAAGRERLRPRLVGEALGRNSVTDDLEPALRAPDPVRSVEQELAADGTLQAGPPEHGDQLLVERPVQADNGVRASFVHSERNTPVTLPRTWTWAARIGS